MGENFEQILSSLFLSSFVSVISLICIILSGDSDLCFIKPQTLFLDSYILRLCL